VTSTEALILSRVRLCLDVHAPPVIHGCLCEDSRLEHVGSVDTLEVYRCTQCHEIEVSES
jgi:hypothetical protein